MTDIVTPSIEERLKRLKLVVLDVDGVLTDGRIFWQHEVGWTRFFHVRDGYGIQRLMRHGIDVGLISAGKSEDLQRRVDKLGITYAYFGSEDKIHAYEEILTQTSFRDEEVAYMGDELFDLPILKRVGFSATVPEAIPEVKESVHYVTRLAGGWGAVREVAEMILSSRP